MTRLTARPALRDIFLRGSKRLEVYFYTSNDDKFLQARAVFEQCGLVLRHFRSRQEPYAEDYSLGKDQLLQAAIVEILKVVGRSSLFFVEDTSLRIDALSESNDYPGLAVKEWFRSTSFEELDQELRKRGEDRRATVKSDIALHLPGVHRPLLFHGTTPGNVADSPPTFDAHPHYPWLTPSTFNGWFIPEGATSRLGAMDFEESCKWDFRVMSLLTLVDRLEEYAAALNLSATAYTRRPRQKPDDRQGTLFQADPTVFIVVGRTCAGKTTFGERARHQHGAHVIEASNVMRSLASDYEHGGLVGFELAHAVLNSRGYDAVARRIVNDMADIDNSTIVITGFRTIEELEVVRSHFPTSRVVLVEASDRTRFERYVKRRRDNSPSDNRTFQKLDKQQWTFGLLRVAEDFADIRIRNEDPLDVYNLQVDYILRSKSGDRPPGVSHKVRPRHQRDKNQVYRCLTALRDAGRALSCDEIEEATGQTGTAILHNNANKVLKKVPELARRLESPSLRVRYELMNAGRAYIRLMES